MAEEKEVTRLFRAVGHCWMAIKQYGRKKLGEMNLDLTIEQVIILKILEENEGLNLYQIAERADRERTTITRMIDGLERRNLVLRVPDKSDNRQKQVYLTKKGWGLLEELRPMAEQIYEGVTQDLDDLNISGAIDILEKISNNLKSEE